jgi:hypothetical protein
MEDKRFTVLQSMKDHYDHLFSRIHYLFVAHGAGLVGCLTVLKDYASTPQYRGLGIPVALFGVGLICTMLSYISLSIAQMMAKNAVLDRSKPAKSETVFWVHYAGLLVSVGTFIGAICIIIWRTISL